MKFEDKVKKYMGKKPKKSEKEYKRRENFINIIEAKVGILQSVPYDRIDTTDLFKIANALSGHMRK